jgi:glyoxylase-like metal-dependent hydrolase (beta-lactamase superfamily II)
MLNRAFASAALALLLAGAQVRAQDPLSVYSYETVKVADGIYLFIETEVHPIVSGNVIAVIGADGVLVFDTGHHPTVSRQIVRDLGRLTRKPVRYIVNSHWHDDHWVGNAEFVAAYPGVQVIAHRFTAAIMAARRDKFRGAQCRADLEKDAATYRQMRATGKRADGSELSAASQARVESFLRDVEAQIVECDRMRFRGVDLAFDQDLDVDLGNRRVELRFLGRANTAGDVVAYIPDAKVLLTGDILVCPFPFATESYISEWARVLQQLEDMDTATIVPGHGQVLHDKGYLTTVKDLMVSISTQVRNAYRPGASLDEVIKQVDLTAFRAKIAGDDAFLRVNFDYMMQSAIDRAYQEVNGTLKPEDQP